MEVGSSTGFSCCYEPERAKPSQLSFGGLGKVLQVVVKPAGVSWGILEARARCVCTSFEKSMKNTDVFGVKPLTSVKSGAIQVSSWKGGDCLPQRFEGPVWSGCRFVWLVFEIVDGGWSLVQSIEVSERR